MQDAQHTGRAFVKTLLKILSAAIAVYAISHIVVASDALRSTDCTADPADTHAAAECESAWSAFAEIDRFGHVRFHGFGEMDWYVGAATARAIMAEVGERSLAIDDTRVALRSFSQRLVERARGPRTTAFKHAIAIGDFAVATDELSAIRAQYAPESFRTLFHGLDFDTAFEQLLFLQRAIEEQTQSLNRLEPPLNSLFFWTSPTLSILEVLFWSLFGVLTNLLVNSAEHLRKNDFNPDERWVAWTKLFYGPVLAAVVVLALINGFFQVESYAIRVWTLPLVAFIFGYASRRTAVLFERIIERFLGAASEGAGAGPQKALETRQAMIAELMAAYRPPTIRALNTKAKDVAHDVLMARMLDRGQPGEQR